MRQSRVTRRKFLRVGSAGLLASGLAGGLASPGRGQDPRSAGGTPKALPARAKTVIFVYLAGGLPQTETFDYKPENGKDNGPRYYKGIPTNVPGIEVCEGIPLLAKLADKYSIIRSMTHPINLWHGDANYLMTTGTLLSKELVHPTVGSVVALKKGDPNTVVPPYVFLTDQRFQFTEAGFLGPAYAPYATGGDPSAPDFNAGLTLPAGMSAQRFGRRQANLRALDTFGRETAGCCDLQRIADYQSKTFKLVEQEGKRAFDLSSEPKEVRERYGMNWFGQCALLARKLVEADNGVKFVKIFWVRGGGAFGGWDTHNGDHYQKTLDNQPDLDRGLSALLEDLSQRGLLASTIVLAGGEMGRKAELDDPLGGRDHWSYGFSWIVAGGGFQGGKVVGKTDHWSRVIDRPVYPWDLWGSVYRLLGIDPAGALPLAEGCGRARILPPMPTNRELWALCKRDRYSTAEKFLDPKEHMVTVCGKCYTDTDEPVTGGLLTEIM